jgi:hypothetical protein
MKHNVVRSLLLILLAGVAMFDIAEGILVLTGVCAPPVNYHGTPFTDATVPMLLVAIVVGGSSLLAAPRWRRALRPHPPALLRRVVARRVPVAVPHLLLLNRRDNLYTTSMMPS